MKGILLFLACISLTMSSCVTVPPSPVVVEKKLSVFPPKPKIVEYTRQPIISKTGNDYLISDELLQNSILFKKYSDMIDEWKALNSVK